MTNQYQRDRNELVQRAIFAAREGDWEATEDYLKSARMYGFIYLRQLDQVNSILVGLGLRPVPPDGLVRPDTLTRRNKRLALVDSTNPGLNLA